MEVIVSTDDRATHWLPEICYEEADEGLTSKIPFIDVPMNEEMPKILFIFEASETGEFEPGPDGEPMPIVDLDLHQYADMNILRDNLSQATYSIVRQALGLEELSSAVEKGRAITEKVRNNIESAS